MIDLVEWKPSTRLAGHSLAAEGRPVVGFDGDWPDDFACHWWFASPGSRGVYVRRGPEGRALCECGEWSPELPSTAARKRWHREHKDEVRTREG